MVFFWSIKNHIGITRSVLLFQCLLLTCSIKIGLEFSAVGSANSLFHYSKIILIVLLCNCFEATLIRENESITTLCYVNYKTLVRLQQCLAVGFIVEISYYLVFRWMNLSVLLLFLCQNLPFGLV